MGAKPQAKIHDVALRAEACAKHIDAEIWERKAEVLRQQVEMAKRDVEIAEREIAVQRTFSMQSRRCVARNVRHVVRKSFC